MNYVLHFFGLPVNLGMVQIGLYLHLGKPNSTSMYQESNICTLVVLERVG